MRVLSLPLIGMCIALVSRGCNFWSRHPPRKRILARGLFPLYFLRLVVPEFARVEVQWNRFGNKSTTESAKSHVPASKRRKPASPRRDDSGRSISRVEILCERRSLDIVHYDSPLFAFPFAIVIFHDASVTRRNFIPSRIRRTGIASSALSKIKSNNYFRLPGPWCISYMSAAIYRRLFSRGDAPFR